LLLLVIADCWSKINDVKNEMRSTSVMLPKLLRVRGTMQILSTEAAFLR